MLQIDPPLRRGIFFALVAPGDPPVARRFAFRRATAEDGAAAIRTGGIVVVRPSLFVLCYALAADVGATVIASDSFACAGTTQAGQGEGVGFGGNWIDDAAEDLVFAPQANSLAAPAGMPVLGGALFYDGVLLQAGHPLASHYGARIYRDLDVSAGSTAATLGLLESHTTYFGTQQLGVGVPGTTLWLGFLLNGGSAGNGVAGLQYLAQVHLYDGLNLATLSADDNNKDGEALAIGRGNGNTQWNVERTCSHSPCGAVTSSVGYVSGVNMDGQTHWAVLRFDFASAATTQMTFWLDPVPGAVAPDPSSALTLTGGLKTVSMPGMHFNWIEFGGQSSTFTLDELRLATTFADLATGASGPPCGSLLFADGFE